MTSGSSFIDLNAEILRKADQLSNVKDGKRKAHGGSKTFSKIKDVVGKKKKKKHKSKERGGGYKHEEDTNNTETDDATLLLLQKARSKLEAKAKIYEKMERGEMEDLENKHGESRYLVDFQHKYYENEEDEEEEEEEEESETPPGAPSFSLSMFEANELHRERMREKWDKEQEDLLEGPVHYEHIKFDEVRDLGTGYFAFSKDEDERRQQLEDFKSLRESTKIEQNKKELLQRKRKAALDERLAKVKSRKLKSNETTSTIIETSVSTDNDLLESLPGHNLHKNVIKDGDESNSSSYINPNLNDMQKIDVMGKEGEAVLNESVLDEAVLDKAVLDEDDELIFQSCRKQSNKEREWDKGKQTYCFLENEKLEKPLYKRWDEEREEDKDSQFAPPSFY